MTSFFFIMSASNCKHLCTERSCWYGECVDQVCMCRICTKIYKMYLKGELRMLSGR